jgi:hypothetical protein
VIGDGIIAVANSNASGDLLPGKRLVLVEQPCQPMVKFLLPTGMACEDNMNV